MAIVRPADLSVHKRGPKNGQDWHCLPKETKNATLFLTWGSMADQRMASCPAGQVAWRLVTSMVKSDKRKPSGLVTFPSRIKPRKSMDCARLAWRLAPLI